MTTIIAILIWALTPLSGDSNCTDYRTGKFSLKDDQLGADHLIERTDSIQTETDLKTGARSKFRVTWVNDCEYELNIIEASPELMNFFKGRTLTIQITNTTKDSYTFKAFVKGIDLVATQTAKRVK